jgi:hypothetical protein
MKIGDSFDDNTQEEIVKEIFVKVDEKEKKKKKCFDTIYVDFSKYLFLEELFVLSLKENSRTSFFFQVGGKQHLPIFFVKTKI